MLSPPCLTVGICFSNVEYCLLELWPKIVTLALASNTFCTFWHIHLGDYIFCLNNYLFIYFWKKRVPSCYFPSVFAINSCSSSNITVDVLATTPTSFCFVFFISSRKDVPFSVTSVLSRVFYTSWRLSSVCSVVHATYHSHDTIRHWDFFEALLALHKPQLLMSDTTE